MHKPVQCCQNHHKTPMLPPDISTFRGEGFCEVIFRYPPELLKYGVYVEPLPKDI